MAEEYVGRKEFDILKQEVNDIKKEMAESQKLLQAIDKKVDRIFEKVDAADKIEDLKLSPLEKRVSKLEDSQIWLRRTLLGEILALISGAIVFVIRLMK